MTQARQPITLIGEEIAGAWNSEALADIAHVFGGAYRAYAADETDGLDDPSRGTLGGYDCLMAAENTPNAASVYSFRPPVAGSHALLVGNEAKGLRRRTRRLANTTVEIPLASRNINCLNVAAAAAVMLYYLSLEQPLNTKRRSLASLQQARPAVLLIGGSDPMELGSALRSVCAFGWERVWLEDAGSAWYECDRRIKSEGRGAARRGRNPIRVQPHRDENLTGLRRILVFTTYPGGESPHRVTLTGSDTVIVLPDEKTSTRPWAPPSTWSGTVTYVSLPPVSSERYHYRQSSAIALAEIARQLGAPPASGIYVSRRKDRYRRAVLRAEDETSLDLADLSIF